ncbi:TetR/AcrR family transcriptional regulator [Kordiimonas laminariae]|uniref:TetR/AcrR family transcriptional regulator n=1 Tax=Kordiimonas laminariae TaxID=2917717 RepID=UPI001FF32554|nr:TetR/AcrR family transcriptional regulator [Kordiimonas laminariae]MCK0071233.1 TetR/AcrR family transcriptional regulator [Kordiimonas laminariae]
MTKETTRERIITVADNLFYEQGFDHTSFADIAGETSISRGNFYHHFKTKDQILEAVIELRLKNTLAMIKEWEAASHCAKERIKSYITILDRNKNKIAKHGCPVGTLTSELAKLSHDAQGSANKIFSLFDEWLQIQFIDIGLNDEAELLSQHVLARSQGIATLYNTFQSDTFLKKEISLLLEWLEETCSTTTANH